MTYQGLLVIVLAVAILFLLLKWNRDLLCWYFKINESLAVLTEIRDLLAAQQKTQKRHPQPANPTKAEREAIAAERASMSADELELERQALAAPRKD